MINATEAETVSSVDGASASGEEHMDTSILEEPQVGRDPVVTHFPGSCKMPAMLELVPDSYCKELLSTRLQGDEIKEALKITIFWQYKQENPCLKPPAWFPAEVLSRSEQELIDRMAFLTRNQTRPGTRHKRKRKVARNSRYTQESPPVPKGRGSFN